MKLKQVLKDYFLLILGAAIIIFIDQWSKGWIRSNLDYGEVYRPDLWITQYARLVHWRNTGMVFGLFQNMNQAFTILPVIISAAILFFFPVYPQTRLADAPGHGFISGWWYGKPD